MFTRETFRSSTPWLYKCSTIACGESCKYQTPSTKTRQFARSVLNWVLDIGVSLEFGDWKLRFADEPSLQITGWVRELQ
jgi:hypothetical protein